ncbi:PIN domain-like protein [Blastocladiella britannica]|nr:PIN domain-like protein [Blastocladiella britannica]
MGIQGLLPLLDRATVRTPLSAYAGKALAVDGNIWLHRAAYACAAAADSDINASSSLFPVRYFHKRITKLWELGIRLYFVFDGAPLPAKNPTSQARSSKRSETILRARELSDAGDKGGADKAMRAAVKVTREMVRIVTEALRAMDVAYIVAPYEADAQLAFLERTGKVDGILSDDSDILVFGCRTLILKLDFESLTGMVITRDALQTKVQDPCDIAGWPHAQLVDWAILSGCDYLPSLSGTGPRTAHKHIKAAVTIANRDYARGQYLPRVLSVIPSDPHLDIGATAAESTSPPYRADLIDKAIQMARFKAMLPPTYCLTARWARLVFRHQRVYCPDTRALVPLRPWPPLSARAEPESDYAKLDLVAMDDDAGVAEIGPWVDPDSACRVASGDVDPINLAPWDGGSPWLADLLALVAQLSTASQGSVRPPLQPACATLVGHSLASDAIIPPPPQLLPLPSSAGSASLAAEMDGMTPWDADDEDTVHVAVEVEAESHCHDGDQENRPASELVPPAPPRGWQRPEGLQHRQVSSSNSGCPKEAADACGLLTPPPTVPLSASRHNSAPVSVGREQPAPTPRPLGLSTGTHRLRLASKRPLVSALGATATSSLQSAYFGGDTKRTKRSF